MKPGRKPVKKRRKTPAQGAKAADSIPVSKKNAKKSAQCVEVERVPPLKICLKNITTGQNKKIQKETKKRKKPGNSAKSTDEVGRIGSLGASQSFHEDTEVLMLPTTVIRKGKKNSKTKKITKKDSKKTNSKKNESKKRNSLLMQMRLNPRRTCNNTDKISPNQDHLDELIGMGFSVASATEALLRNNNSIHLALDTLISMNEESVKSVEISSAGEHILRTTENEKSRVLFEPEFIPKEQVDELMAILNSTATWYDKNIIIHGQEVPHPGLISWYGPFPYVYSGAYLEPAEMTPTIANIKDRIAKYLKEYDINVNLNSVLLNLYRDKKDSMAWQSDATLPFDCSPTVAYVSLGAVKKFQMRTKSHISDGIAEHYINLTPGSLVILDGSMQRDWEHQIPKECHDRPLGITLTFWEVYSCDKFQERTYQEPSAECLKLD